MATSAAASALKCASRSGMPSSLLALSRASTANAHSAWAASVRRARAKKNRKNPSCSGAIRYHDQTVFATGRYPPERLGIVVFVNIPRIDYILSSRKHKPIASFQLDDLASVLFTTSEGSSVDDVALASNWNDSPTEQKGALVLIVAFIAHFVLLSFCVVGCCCASVSEQRARGSGASDSSPKGRKRAASSAE